MESKLKYTLKIRLLKDEVFYGPGTHELLKLIDQLQSVKQASLKMSMSYSKAWRMLKKIESELNDNVVIKNHGGTNGGSTTLSPLGNYLVNEYERFLAECQSDIDRIKMKYFKEL